LSPELKSVLFTASVLVVVVVTAALLVKAIRTKPDPLTKYYDRPPTELARLGRMTESQRVTFIAAMAQHRKSVGVALLFAFFGFFGLHRLYLCQVGLGFLMLITIGGCLISAFIDLLRINSIVRAVNDEKANEIARQLGFRPSPVLAAPNLPRGEEDR
jgi:TM2 domain-containing membrane protein YozV